MKSVFTATCPNSNEAVIVVLGVTTVSEFRAAAAAQGLIRTCDDEEGYEFYKPLQAWAVLTPEGTWDLGASSDAPDALPAMVATARWVSITSCQCEACPVKDGTHKPAEAVHEIAEPKTQQHEALRLADELGMWHCPPSHILDKAAAELRRQHARIVELESLLSAAQQAVQAAVPLPMVELFGVKDGQETSLGTVPMPPTMRARELLQDIGFRGLDDDDGDGAYAMAACEQLIEYCKAYYEAPAHPAEGVPAQAEPFMWAIQEPGGSAYMDKNCVSTSRGIVEAEVDGLNLGLDADDEQYKVVPVYLAATQPADGAPAQEVQAAIDRFDAYFRSANGVPPNARVTVPTAEWQELRAMLSTHPTQQGMDAIAALQKVRDIAVSALLTGSLDRQDWIDDMDRIAAQAKQGGAV